MAYTTAQAILKGNSLAEPFMAHFKKAYNEGVTSPHFHHHCQEMQVW